MPRYLICVLHDAGAQTAGTAYDTDADMQAAFERVGAFNDKLEAEGRMVLAAGLLPREMAAHVDPSSSPEAVDGPVDGGGATELGGFWIIDADDDAHARTLLADASAACGQRLELRRLAE